MQRIALISLLLILNVNSFEYFFTNPQQNFNLGSVQATTIQLADDESMVVVGFQSGLVETYNIQGRFLSNVTGHTNPIVTIDWLQVSDFTGFVTVDSSGLLLVSYSNGTQVGNFTFPSTGQPLKNMLVTVSDQALRIYLGLVYSTKIVEYYYQFTNNTISFGFSRNYTVNNIVAALYTTSGYNQLFVGLSNSTVMAFNCTNGIQFQSIIGAVIGSLSTNNSINPVAFLPYGNNYLLLDSSSSFTEFNGTDFVGQSFQSTKPGSVATVCPSNLEVLFGYSSQAVIIAFQFGQTAGQQLSYLKSNARALDCGQNNLISLDQANNLAFNSYNIVDSKVLGWVIAVIVISIVLFIALIVTIIYCVCKKRKQQALLNNSDYGKELNSSRR